MAVERISGGSSLIDVLDRVLDKGIVIDAWVRISLVGIDLITVEARVGKEWTAQADGRTKKIAAQRAARGLYERLMRDPIVPSWTTTPSRIRRTRAPRTIRPVVT